MAKKEDFLTRFMGNRDCARVLRVFVLNADDTLTLGDVIKRAGVSARAATREIKALVKLDIVKEAKASIALNNGSKRRIASKQKMQAWALDKDFKYARAVSAFVHEVSPVKYDELVGALKKAGRVSTVIISGAFMGDMTRPADLIVAADVVNERKLAAAIRTLEPAIGREIRYAAFSTPELRYRLTIQDKLLRDTLDFPHLVLFDKTRML